MEIEIGDFVEIIKGVDNGWPINEGWIGVLDNIFVENGVTMYAVIDETNEEVFYYATEIKLYKKA